MKTNSIRQLINQNKSKCIKRKCITKCSIKQNENNVNLHINENIHINKVNNICRNINGYSLYLLHLVKKLRH